MYSIIRNNVLILALYAAVFPSMADTLEITTPQGPVRGVVNEAGIAVFKGIPYARPPTGIRRWRYAEAPYDWEGVRLADTFGPTCIQRERTRGYWAVATRPMSEDCLYLNIWTGSDDSPPTEELKPVMVWIHGGSLRTGTGSNGAYNGTALALKGVVLVTINYRLDLLGYFAHPELAAENPHGATGNYGTSDQIAALKWVQRNISSYGGDPENVTIFGESAGAWAVHHMMAAPQARGLFHKGIAQSGHRFGTMRTKQEAMERGETFQQATGAKSLTELRAMDWHELMSQRFRSSPNVDGHLFSDQIYALFKSGRQNNVPLIAGFNAHESTTLGGLNRIPESEDAFRSRVERIYGDLADDFFEVYPIEKLRESSLASSRDSSFGWGTHAYGHLGTEPFYQYFFSHEPQGQPLGAFHAAEILYAFDNVGESSPPAFHDLAETMSNYWVSFARTGKPRVKGQPEWPSWTREDKHYLEFGTDGANARENLLPGTFEFFDKVNAARRAQMENNQADENR